METHSPIDLSHVHMVGVGGAGMSGLARILLDKGAKLSGSDVKDSRVLLGIRAAGGVITVGHAASNITDHDPLPSVVVTSFAAIPADNPELSAARELGIPIIYRSDLLAELMRDKTQVLIAGTHGKTSTTSMAVVALQQAGLDPSFAIGGQLNKAGTNAHHGTGECFVAEADESDASLLRYQPTVGVITNIEPDHLDFFHTEEKYFQVFDDFADRVTDDGYLLVCLDDEHAAACGRRARGRGVNVYGYGTKAAADRETDIPALVTIDNLSHQSGASQATLTVRDGDSYPLSSAIPGEHMLLNATAAVGAGILVGADPQDLTCGVVEFTGVRRRFEFKGRVTSGKYAGVEVFDDYAHHPTEVRAVLTASRKLADAHNREVIAIFQPHLYSRTINFAQEFADALSLADKVVLLDIFPAREKPVPGVDGRIISEKVTADVIYEANMAHVPEVIASIAQPDSLILTIGAGSVTVLGEEILDRLTHA